MTDQRVGVAIVLQGSCGAALRHAAFGCPCEGTPIDITAAPVV